MRVVIMVVGLAVACYGMATERRTVAWCGAVIIAVGIAVPL